MRTCVHLFVLVYLGICVCVCLCLSLAMCFIKPTMRPMGHSPNDSPPDSCEGETSDPAHAPLWGRRPASFFIMTKHLIIRLGHFTRLKPLTGQPSTSVGLDLMEGSPKLQDRANFIPLAAPCLPATVRLRPPTSAARRSSMIATLAKRASVNKCSV